MKIAAATNDGCNIAPDLAYAAYYMVLDIEEGVITHRELRDKLPRGWYRALGHAEHHGPSSSSPEAPPTFDALTDPIRDCRILLAANLDPEEAGSIAQARITPINVRPMTIDEAVGEQVLAHDLLRPQQY